MAIFVGGAREKWKGLKSLGRREVWKTWCPKAIHCLAHYTWTLARRPFGWEYADADSHATLALHGSLNVKNVQTYHGAGLAGPELIQAGRPSLVPYLGCGELVEALSDLRPAPLPVSIVSRWQLIGARLPPMSWVIGAAFLCVNAQPQPRGHVAGRIRLVKEDGLPVATEAASDIPPSARLDPLLPPCSPQPSPAHRRCLKIRTLRQFASPAAAVIAM